MARKSRNDVLIQSEMAEIAVILGALPANPIPWAAVLKIVAPVVARLAVRVAMKKIARGISDEKLQATTKTVADYISDIIKARLDGGGVNP